MWPRLAEYFGAKATSDQTFTKTSPQEGQLQLDHSFLEWSAGKRKIWDQLCAKNDVPSAKATFDIGTRAFQDWVCQRSWSATLSISKARRYGWTGYKDSYECFVETFDKFKKFGLIPA